MFEKALSDALVERFGKYIDGLDSENLTVAAWRGEVLLEGLQLKPEAFEDLAAELGLPLRLGWGRVGKFYLKVPWKALGLAAITVKLEDIDMLMLPDECDEWVDAKLRQRSMAQTTKEIQRLLELRLERWRSQKANALAFEVGAKGDVGAASSGSGAWGLMEALARRALDNLQVSVAGLHVRFEDRRGKCSGAGVPIACGLTLSSFNVVTDAQSNSVENSGGTAGSGSGSDEGHKARPVFKEVAVSDLGVYWESSGPNSGSNGSKESKRDGHDKVDKVDYVVSMPAPPGRESYVLLPASPCLKLALRRSAASATAPRAQVSGSVDALALMVNAAQVEGAWSLQRWMTAQKAWETAALWSASRPAANVVRAWAQGRGGADFTTRQGRPMGRPSRGESAREWWKFVGQACAPGAPLGRSRLRLSWPRALALARWHRDYARLFARKLELVHYLELVKGRSSKEAHGSASGNNNYVNHASSEWSSESTEFAALCVEINAAELDWSAPVIAAARAKAHIYFETHLEAQKAHAKQQEQERLSASSGGAASTDGVEDVAPESASGWGAWLGSKLWTAAAADNSEHTAVDDVASRNGSGGFRASNFSRKALLEATHINADEYEMNEEWTCPDDWPLLHASLTIGAVSATLLDYASAQPSDLSTEASVSPSIMDDTHEASASNSGTGDVDCSPRGEGFEALSKVALTVVEVKFTQRPTSWDCSAALGSLRVADARSVTAAAFPYLLQPLAADYSRPKGSIPMSGDTNSSSDDVDEIGASDEFQDEAEALELSGASLRLHIALNPTIAPVDTPEAEAMDVQLTVAPFQAVHAPSGLWVDVKRLLAGKSNRCPQPLLSPLDGTCRQSSDDGGVSGVGSSGDESNYEGGSDDEDVEGSLSLRMAQWRDQQARALFASMIAHGANIRGSSNGEEFGSKNSRNDQSSGGRLCVSVDWAAPLVVVPEDAFDMSGAAVIMDLGHFKLRSINEVIVQNERGLGLKSTVIEPLKVTEPTHRHSVDSEDEFEDANGESDDEGDVAESAPIKVGSQTPANGSIHCGALNDATTTSTIRNASEHDGHLVSKGRLLGWRCTLSDMTVLTAPSLALAQNSHDGNNHFLVGATLEPFIERFSVVVNIRNKSPCTVNTTDTSSAQSAQSTKLSQTAEGPHVQRDDSKLPCAEATVTLPRLKVALRTSTFKRLLRVHAAALQASTKYSQGAPHETTQRKVGTYSTSVDGALDNSSSDHEESAEDVAVKSKSKDAASIWRVKFAAPLVLLDLRTEEPSTLALRESISRHMPTMSSDVAVGRFPGDDVSVPLVRLRLGGLSGELAFSEHNKRTKLTVTLRSMEVIDDLQAAGPAFAKLLASTEQQRSSSSDSSQVATNDLMSVQVDSSPWGKQIALALNSIFVQWNPETLIALHDFMKIKSDEITPEISPVMTRSLSSPRAKRLIRRRSDESAHSKTQKPEETKLQGTSEVVSNVAPHTLVEVSLRSVTVSFNREGCAAHLCEACLDDAKAFYFKPGSGGEEHASETFGGIDDTTNGSCTNSGASRGDAFGGGLGTSKDSGSNAAPFRKLSWGDTRVSGTLGNFSLTDVSTPGTRYREILGLQRTSGQQIGKLGKENRSTLALPHNSSLVQFSYTMFGGQRAQRLGFGSALDLEMSPVRLCYVQQYWLELWDYVFSAVLVGSVLGAGSARTPLAELPPEPKEYVPAFEYGDLRHRRRLRVKFHSPVLVLPAHPFTNAHLELDLGTWHLENYYIWTDPRTGDPLREDCSEDRTPENEVLAADGTPLGPPLYSHADAMDRHHFSISVSHIGIASVDARAPDNTTPDEFATTDAQQDVARKATNDGEDFFDAFDAFESDAFNDTLPGSEGEGDGSVRSADVDSKEAAHVSSNRRARSLIMKRAGVSVDVSWAADGRPVSLPDRPHHYVVTVAVPALLVELQHADYTLIRRFLDFNVGALPRVPLHRLGTGTTAVSSPGRVLDHTPEKDSLSSAATDLPTAHVQFGYDAQSGPPSTYNLKITMETVCVGFATDDGAPLTQLQIGGMSYALKQSLPDDDSSGSTGPRLVLSETDVRCQSIEILDRRRYASPRAFASLMRPLRAQDARHEFTSSSQNSASNADLGSNVSLDIQSSFDDADVAIASPTLCYGSVATAGVGVESHLTISEACIYHLPGAFKDLASFCAYEAWPDDALSAACVARRRRRDRSQPSTACFLPVYSTNGSDGIQPAVPAKAPPGPHSSLHVAVKSPHFVLLDDVNDSDSAALVVRLREFVAVQSTADPSRIESCWKARMSDLEMTRVWRALEPADLAVFGTQRPLFAPTYLRLDVDTVKKGSSAFDATSDSRTDDDVESRNRNGVNVDRKATLELGPLCAHYGVNDAALSFRIISSLADNDCADPPLAFYKAPCPVDAVSPLNLEAMRLASMTNVTDNVNSPSLDSSEKSIPSMQTRCSFECAQVSMVLVDDTVQANGDVILLNASLEGVKAAYDDDASKDVNVEVGGSHVNYNSNNSMHKEEADEDVLPNNRVSKCQRLTFEVTAICVDDLLVIHPLSPFRRVLATTLADAAPTIDFSTDAPTVGHDGHGTSSTLSNSSGDTSNASQDPLLAVSLLRFADGTRRLSLRLNVLEAAWHPTLVRRLHHCFLAFLVQTKGRRNCTESTDVANCRATETEEHSMPGVEVGDDTDPPSSSSSTAGAALEVNVSIVALRLRLDKEAEQRALLWVTLRRARLYYFNQKPESSERLLPKDQAMTRVFGSLASLDAEDAISKDTLYRTVFGLDPRTVSHSSHTDLVRFSYISANRCGQGVSRRSPGSPSDPTEGDFESNPTRQGSETEGGLEDNAECNMATLAVAPVRIVFLQQFALECVDYLVAGMLGTAVSGGIARAKNFVADKLLVAPPLQTKNDSEVASAKTAICLDLHRPRLLLPSNCKSHVRLEASLSCIKVRTQFNARTVTLQKPHTSSTDAPSDRDNDKCADVNDGDNSQTVSLSGTETIWMRTLHVDVVDIDMRAVDMSPPGACSTTDTDPKSIDDLRNANPVESGQSLTAQPVCVDFKVTNPLDSARSTVLQDIYGVDDVSCTVLNGTMSRLTVTLDDVRYRVLVAVVNGNLGDSRQHGSNVSNEHHVDDPISSGDDNDGEESDDSRSSDNDVYDGVEDDDNVTVQFNYRNSAAPVTALSSTLRLEGVGVDFYFSSNDKVATASAEDSSLTTPSLSLALDTVALSSERTTQGHSQLDLQVGALRLTDLRPGKHVRTLIAPASEPIPAASEEQSSGTGVADCEPSTGVTPALSRASAQPPSSTSPSLLASPALVVHKADRGLVECTSLSVVCNDLTVNVAYDPILCLAHFLARPLTVKEDGAGDCGSDGVVASAPSPPSTAQEVLPPLPPPPGPTPANSTPSKSSKKGTTRRYRAQSAIDRREYVAVPSIRRYKLLLHHPRVFLWENEASPSSRVLVLKGLVVLDGKIQTSSESGQFTRGSESVHCANGRCAEAFSARLEKLESFIVANGHAAFTNEVSLLEPLSMHLSLERSSQPLYPTKREVSISVEPIALRCSYRDVQLLGALASQWTSASRQTIATATANARAATSTAAQPTSSAVDESFIPPDSSDDANTSVRELEERNDSSMSMNAEGDSAAASDEYCVVFTEAKLGLTLQRYKGLQLAYIEAIKTPASPPASSIHEDAASGTSAEAVSYAAKAAVASAVEGLGLRATNLPVCHAPDVGDVILAVGGDYVTRCNYDTTVDMLRTAPRPLVITFRKPHFLEDNNAMNATSGARMGSPQANSRHRISTGSSNYIHGSSTAVPPSSLNAPVSLLPGPCEMDVEVLDRHSLDSLSLARGGGDGNTLVLKSTEAYLKNWLLKQQKTKSAAAAAAGEEIVVEGAGLATEDTASKATVREKKKRGRDQWPVLPRCGAVLIAIDGKSIQGFGFDQAVATLMATSSPSNTADSASDASSFGPKSNKMYENLHSQKKKLLLRFREVETWAPRDTLNVSFAGLQMLAIDDCGGFRDLPLLKVGCGSVSATADLGTGKPWRWLNLRPHVRGVRLLIASHGLSIEYFNRRIGHWEPLLEPCDLRLDLEAEYRPRERIEEDKGQPRPGSTPNEPTTQDNEEREDDGISGWFRGDVALRASTNGAVSVNVTEAALELLVGVAAEWETSKAATATAIDKASEKFGDNTSNSSGSKFEDASIARIASLAAPSRKPFVFHNATGHDLTFTLTRQHTQASSSYSSFDGDTSFSRRIETSRRTELSSNRLAKHAVSAGAAVPFSLDDRSADQLSTEGNLGSASSSSSSSYGSLTSHGESTHRSHDSSPPLVQVTFAENAFAAVTNLPVGRVGVRRASTVAIRNTPLMGSFATTKTTTSSSSSSNISSGSSGGGGVAAVPLPLLWEVVLLDGQHHLTLRSAVAVQNNTGSPLQAGIPNYAVGRDDPGYAWQRVLAPAEVVSLPLAVAHAAHLVLKPRADIDRGDGGASASGGALSSSSEDSAGKEVDDEFEWSDSVFSGATAAAPFTSSRRFKGSVVCRRRDTSGQRNGSNSIGSGLSLPYKLALTPSTALPPCPALLPSTIASLSEDQGNKSSRLHDEEIISLTSTSGAAATATTLVKDLAAATSNMPQGPWAMTLHVHPAAALRSLLPTPLEWSMRSDFSALAGSSGSAARVVQFLGNGTLKPATRTWLPQVGDLGRTEVQICLPNGLSRWSDWAPLSNIVSSTASNTSTTASSFAASLGPTAASSSSPTSNRLRIPLRDNADGVLCICAELDTRQGHAPTVVFFSEFWLRNLSSLPLVYGTFLAPPSARSIGAIGGVSGSSSGGSGRGMDTGRTAPVSTSRNASMYPGASSDFNSGIAAGEGADAGERSTASGARWKSEVGGMANALEVIGGSDAWCAHAAWQDPSIPVVEELFEVVVRETMSEGFSDTLARKKRVRTRLLMHGGDLLSSAASNASNSLRGGPKTVDERLPGPGFRFLHWCDASGLKVINPNKTSEQLPSDRWGWVQETWAVDDTGAATGYSLHPDGWETSATGTFSTSLRGCRKFCPTDRFWRRRWVRTRMRMRGKEDDNINSGGTSGSSIDGSGREDTEGAAAARIVNGRNVALFHLPMKYDQNSARKSSNPLDSMNTSVSTSATTNATANAPAGLVLKLGDSRWSDALDVGGMAQNSKGDVTVIGSRWMPELGFATRVAGSPGMPMRRKATAPLSPSSPTVPPSTSGPAPTASRTTSPSAATPSVAPVQANEGPDDSLTATPAPTPLYELAWQVKSASGAFGRTRVVTLQDRFTLINQSTRRILRVQQMGSNDATSGASPLVLVPGASAPFHWTCAAHKRLLVVSFVDSSDLSVLSSSSSSSSSLSPNVEPPSWEWSGGIDPSAVGTYSVFVRPSSLVKRGKGGEKDMNPRTLRVSVSTTSGGEDIGGDGRAGNSEGATGGSGALEIVFQEEEEEEEEAKELKAAASTDVANNDNESADIKNKKKSPMNASAQPETPPRLPALVRAENLTGWGIYFAQVGVPLLPHPHAQSTSFPFQRAPKPTRVPPNAPGGSGEPGPSHHRQQQVQGGGGKGGRGGKGASTHTSATAAASSPNTAAVMAIAATDAAWPCDVLLPHHARAVAWDRPCPPPSKRQALRLSLAPLQNLTSVNSSSSSSSNGGAVVPVSPNEGCLNLTVGGSATLPPVSCVTHSGAPLVIGPVLVVAMSEGPSIVLRFLPSAPPPRLLTPANLSSMNLAAAALGAFDPSPSFAAKKQQEAAARAAVRAADAAAAATILADATSASGAAAAANANASLGANNAVAVRGRQIQCRAYLKGVQVSLIAHGGEGAQLRREVSFFGACRGLGSGRTSGSGSGSGSSGLVPRELLVLSGQDLSLDWEPSMYPGGATKIDLKLSAVQIDNHLPQAPFPVLLLANPSLLREEGSGGSSGATSTTGTRPSAPPAISVAISLLPRGPRLLHVRRLDVEVGSRVHLGFDDGTVAALQALATRVLAVRAASVHAPDSAAPESPLWNLPPESLVFHYQHPTGGRGSHSSNSGSDRAGGGGGGPMMTMVFVEKAHVAPVKVALSLARARETADDMYVGLGAGRLLLDVLARCEGARLKLDAWDVESTLLNRTSDLQALAMAHYGRSARRQLFSALGSLAAFGDPAGLARGVARGTSDAFTAPLAGLMRAATTGKISELTRGLQQGTQSFATHTVGGVAKSAALFSASVATAGSALSLDKDFKMRRAERRPDGGGSGYGQQQQQPFGTGSGGEGSRSGSFNNNGPLGSVGTAVVDGVYEGFAGLVKGPAEGFASGGVRGGMHGAGKGLVGFFVKPVVGFSDAATDVFNTVQSATRPSNAYSSLHRSNSGLNSSSGGGDEGDNSSPGGGMAVTNSSSVQQARPPRAFYGAPRVIRPYQAEDALAVMLLRTVIADQSSLQNRKRTDSGATANNEIDGDEEEYLDHLDLGAFVLLLSTRRLVVVDDSGRPHLALWLKDVACCERRSDGVALHLFDPVDVTPTTSSISFSSSSSSSSSRSSSGSVNHNQRAREAERVHVRAALNHERGGGSASDKSSTSTLVRFIKCADEPTRRDIDSRIQSALQQLV